MILLKSQVVKRAKMRRKRIGFDSFVSTKNSSRIILLFIVAIVLAWVIQPIYVFRLTVLTTIILLPR
jgi:hypothetical protein